MLLELFKLITKQNKLQLKYKLYSYIIIFFIVGFEMKS